MSTETTETVSKFEVTKISDGNYEVKEIAQKVPQVPELHGGNRKPISWEPVPGVVVRERYYIKLLLIILQASWILRPR